jgi:hypothetical protein
VVKIREYGSAESYKMLGPLAGGSLPKTTGKLDDLWS